jgi:hypothetical protein
VGPADSHLAKFQSWNIRIDEEGNKWQPTLLN